MSTKKFGESSKSVAARTTKKSDDPSKWKPGQTMPTAVPWLFLDELGVWDKSDKGNKPKSPQTPSQASVQKPIPKLTSNSKFTDTTSKPTPKSTLNATPKSMSIAKAVPKTTHKAVPKQVVSNKKTPPQTVTESRPTTKTSKTGSQPIYEQTMPTAVPWLFLDEMGVWDDKNKSHNSKSANENSTFSAKPAKTNSSHQSVNTNTSFGTKSINTNLNTKSFNTNSRTKSINSNSSTKSESSTKSFNNTNATKNNSTIVHKNYSTVSKNSVNVSSKAVTLKPKAVPVPSAAISMTIPMHSIQSKSESKGINSRYAQPRSSLTSKVASVQKTVNSINKGAPIPKAGITKSNITKVATSNYTLNKATLPKSNQTKSGSLNYNNNVSRPSEKVGKKREVSPEPFRPAKRRNTDRNNLEGLDQRQISSLIQSIFPRYEVIREEAVSSKLAKKEDDEQERLDQRRRLLKAKKNKYTLQNNNSYWKLELIKIFRQNQNVNDKELLVKSNQDAFDLLSFLKSNRRYNELMAQSNKLYGLTEKQRIDKAANRVGLKTPSDQDILLPFESIPS
ncbi:9147_t:CDS:2 [Diversispora eburnea]|uniref:9147_t:CDS:1 n=1 Tax=Diversispora eburnea TaxID=1213867 RepID=A0A9N9FPW4_9GLOM|nr:9147_t:CDS:2 [Diversispora eburnea]